MDRKFSPKQYKKAETGPAPKAGGEGFYLEDHRPKTTTQLKSDADATARATNNENQSNLPAQLKSGIENLSGISMNDVKVHYNSDKPVQLQAHAYAQGTDIHIATGQEKHLPHEAWHVVQQKQGRVKPTMQMKGKVNINNNAGLENEADVMGRRSLQFKSVEEENNYTPVEQAPIGALNASHGHVDEGVVQPFGLGDLFTVAGTVAGGIGGALTAGPLGAIAGASAGAYAADKLRKQVNDYRNQGTGYKVTIMTSGGIIHDTVAKQKASSRTSREEGIAQGALKGAIGTFAKITGHVSLQLEKSENNAVTTETYDMVGTGVRKINNVSGSTRETHNITREQYVKIHNKIQQDIGKHIQHTYFDFNALKKIVGVRGANVASCAGWAINVLEEANVPAGTLFDRYIFPIPKLIAQSGWDKTLQSAGLVAGDVKLKSHILAHEGIRNAGEYREKLQASREDIEHRSVTWAEEQIENTKDT
jgi:hypothetical protein